jgi:hypothetical protein
MRCFMVAAVCVCLSTPSFAREAIGALGLQVRPGSVTPSGRSAGAGIEVLLEAATPIEHVRLSFLRSDGTPLTAATRPIDPGPLSWRRPGGSDPEEAGDLSLAAGTVLRASVQVPLPHKGSYEIVVRATGESATGPVTTEGMVRIDFGVSSTTYVEHDGVAEFTAQEVRP